MQDERAQIYEQQCNLSHKHDPEITNYSHHNDSFAQQCSHEILVLLLLEQPLKIPIACTLWKGLLLASLLLWAERKER